MESTPTYVPADTFARYSRYNPRYVKEARERRVVKRSLEALTGLADKVASESAALFASSALLEVVKALLGL